MHCVALARRLGQAFEQDEPPVLSFGQWVGTNGACVDTKVTVVTLSCTGLNQVAPREQGLEQPCF